MSVRIIGAIFVIIGCGGFGILIATNHRLQEKALRQLIVTLDTMECELQYRQPPLSELCRIVAKNNCGIIKSVLLSLSSELEKQISPSVESCMLAVLQNKYDLPIILNDPLIQLGQSLGKFDLDGQLKGIRITREECQRKLDQYTKDQDNRIRCYKTLSICAGAALAILFI